MKITCQSCGKRYDTDIDELCPKCGSYNPINRETADPDGSYAEEKSYQDIDGNRSSRNRKNRKIRKNRSPGNQNPDQYSKMFLR